MKYGYFDEKNKEYIITRPDTPTPWINYIGDGDYGGIISNTAGGYSFHKDPRYRRILRYRYNAIPEDQSGRYLYIRDEETSEYWSSTWQPVKTHLDKYQCRHGLGYTIISSEKSKISTEATYFVPLNTNFEYWAFKIKNLSEKNRKLKTFSYAEFSFYDAVMDQQDVDWVQQIGQGEFKDGVISFYNPMKSGFTFFASNGNIDGYDCDRDYFIGGYNDLKNPAAVVKGKCSNSRLYRGNGVGVISHTLNLAPGEEKTLVFMLGIVPKIEGAFEVKKKFCSPKTAANEFEKLNANWNAYVSKLQVKTPDNDMDLMVNIWNQYQCKCTFNWSRFVSLYQLGIGRGMGFRDSSQDILGILHAMPDVAKKRIIQLLKNQFKKGDAYHQYYPLTGEGDGKGYSDDHLWIILSVANYLKETGDMAFLGAIIPYANNEGKGTVLEHLEKAIEFSLHDTGPHDLPLIRFADWNDTVNLDKGKHKAESIFVAFLLAYALQEMIAIYHFIGKKNKAEKYAKTWQALKKQINKIAWDGKWYIRAFDDNGRKLGSKKCKTGKIYLEHLGWSVLSGVIPENKTITMLDTVHDLMNTKYGLILMWPAYHGLDPTKGGVTTYPPGAKENGGIFLHTNPWIIIAETIIGRGDNAYKYYRQILPPAHNNIADIRKAEPYVYCQNILGKEHPLFGLGRNSWLTGTAAWTLTAAVNYILGIKPDFDGLRIDPSIPKSWGSFTVQRVFRNDTYIIDVRNPSHVSKGIKNMTVDGKLIAGNKVPIFNDAKVHKVLVTMGA